MSINVKLGNNIINGVDVVKLQDATTEGLYHSLVEPSGNQDITNLDEYDVTNKATARVSATERAKIIAENIKKDVSILGVTGSFEGGGSVSTQSQSIFTGWTAPLTYLNSTDNIFEYKSATHNITITGLDNIATISGNGTKNVTVTIDTTSTSDRQTAFTITCSNDSQSLTYNGIAFHYGTDVASGKCLAVAQTLINNQIDYIFIESSSLPYFESNGLYGSTTLWNNIYDYQIISFIFAKSNVTSIDSYFLYSCNSFNQPITIPNSVTSIGSYFLSYCCSFNQPITIPNSVTSIGSYFLSCCYSFKQPITIPSNVTNIGSYFLYYCRSFNQPITIPSNVTSIGSAFLRCCYSFNQPITIPSNVTNIDSYFLGNCWSFNQPITIPNSVTSIGSNFFQECVSFNQPITIPSNVTSIGSAFLSACWSFNQPITIPNSVTSIGNNFLNNCRSFNQPITIPNSVTSIGSNFLGSCYCLIYVEYNASVYPSDNNSLSQTINSKTSTYGTGIKVVGTGAIGLKAALPGRTSSPYRKLV